MQLPRPVVLTFAASDPTGGAGIQADLMTATALGCHVISVITALTAQDTLGVKGIWPVGDDRVEEQARTVLSDIPVACFKIGLVGSAENIGVIARIVSDYPDLPVVLDPVLASGRGDEMANQDMISALIELLLPRVSIMTPNSLEARRLIRAANEGDGETDLPLEDCARRLIALGCPHVLITGTHEVTRQVINALYNADGLVRSDCWERLPGSYHGSGCTLASAVAARLAHGLAIGDAVREAQEYTWQTLATGFRPGNGQFIPDRFFRVRRQG